MPESVENQSAPDEAGRNGGITDGDRVTAPQQRFRLPAADSGPRRRRDPQAGRQGGARGDSMHVSTCWTSSRPYSSSWWCSRIWWNISARTIQFSRRSMRPLSLNGLPVVRARERHAGQTIAQRYGLPQDVRQIAAAAHLSATLLPRTFCAGRRRRRKSHSGSAVAPLVSAQPVASGA